MRLLPSCTTVPSLPFPPSPQKKGRGVRVKEWSTVLSAPTWPGYHEFSPLPLPPRKTRLRTVYEAVAQQPWLTKYTSNKLLRTYSPSTIGRKTPTFSLTKAVVQCTFCAGIRTGNGLPRSPITAPPPAMAIHHFSVLIFPKISPHHFFESNHAKRFLKNVRSKV